MDPWHLGLKITMMPHRFWILYLEISNKLYIGR